MNDSIKPVGPVWPGRPRTGPERTERRHEQPQRNRDQPATTRRKQDRSGKLDEYAGTHGQS